MASSWAAKGLSVAEGQELFGRLAGPDQGCLAVSNRLGLQLRPGRRRSHQRLPDSSRWSRRRIVGLGREMPGRRFRKRDVRERVQLHDHLAHRLDHARERHHDVALAKHPLPGAGQGREGRPVRIPEEEQVTAACRKRGGQAGVMGDAVQRAARDRDREPVGGFPLEPVFDPQVIVGHDQVVRLVPARPLRFDHGDHDVRGGVDHLAVRERSDVSGSGSGGADRQAQEQRGQPERRGAGHRFPLQW